MIPYSPVLAPEDIFANPSNTPEPALGWAAFLDYGFIGQMLVVLGMAIALSASIAYHPSLRGKATTLEELEQPKTFIMYAMVGALIAIKAPTIAYMMKVLGCSSSSSVVALPRRLG